jgi:ribonucleotide monophosphatase NagD (HAD superfamily)
MIGDNIESDILGPIDLGWDTILVKTGVHKQDHPHATINSDNIL